MFTYLRLFEFLRVLHFLVFISIVINLNNLTTETTLFLINTNLKASYYSIDSSTNFFLLPTCFSFNVNFIFDTNTSYSNFFIFENYFYNTTSELINSFSLKVNSDFFINSYLSFDSNLLIIQHSEYLDLNLFVSIVILYSLISFSYFFRNLHWTR